MSTSRPFHCSVQCSGHLLHQRPYWLSPEAAVWKGGKGQQQVRGEGVKGGLGPHIGEARGLVARTETWRQSQALLRDPEKAARHEGPLGEAGHLGPVGVAPPSFLPEKESSLLSLRRCGCAAAFALRISQLRVLALFPLVWPWKFCPCSLTSAL